MRSDWVEEVDREARTWLNTPYVPEGRVKGVGVDCGALLYEVYGPIFGPFPTYPSYSPDWSLHDKEERYLDFIKPFVHEINSPRAGGFSVYHLGLVYAHAAILLPSGSYIHAWGRNRAGRCTLSHPRVLNWLVKEHSHGFPAKHFWPNEAL